MRDRWVIMEINMISSFLRTYEVIQKVSGAYRFWSLFSTSLGLQTREIRSFSAISLFGLSLASSSCLPNKPLVNFWFLNGFINDSCKVMHVSKEPRSQINCSRDIIDSIKTQS